jgi:hypothetical protein
VQRTAHVTVRERSWVRAARHGKRTLKDKPSQQRSDRIYLITDSRHDKNTDLPYLLAFVMDLYHNKPHHGFIHLCPASLRILRR